MRNGTYPLMFIGRVYNKWSAKEIEPIVYLLCILNLIRKFDREGFIELFHCHKTVILMFFVLIFFFLFKL